MPDNLPILYSFRRCPYAMRARMTLRYSGIQCELREVVLRAKPPEMLAASPKGTVPVLVTAAANGTQRVIDESLDIMLWALGQHDPDGWLDIDRDAAASLISDNDNDFKTRLDRYKYPDRAAHVAADTADPWAACAPFFSLLDKRLSRHAFLMGDSLSYVDVAIFPFIRQFAFVDRDRFAAAPYKHLQGWLAGLLEAELFTGVMKKYPAWQAGDDKVVF